MSIESDRPRRPLDIDDLLDQDVNGEPGYRIRQRTALDPGPKDTVVGVESRQGRQSSQVDLLPLGLSRIPGTRIKPGREAQIHHLIGDAVEFRS